jgi:hypothetical protein
MCDGHLMIDRAYVDWYKEKHGRCMDSVFAGLSTETDVVVHSWSRLSIKGGRHLRLTRV